MKIEIVIEKVGRGWSVADKTNNRTVAGGTAISKVVRQLVHYLLNILDERTPEGSAALKRQLRLRAAEAERSWRP